MKKGRSGFEGKRHSEEAIRKIKLARAKQVFPLFLLFLLVLPIISAQNELVVPDEVFAQFNTEFDLKRACFFNGTYCSTSAQCNVTIKYEDGSLMVDNQQMTTNASFRNKTLTQLQMNRLGVHPSTMICCDAATIGCGSDGFDLVITADGRKDQIFPTQFFVIILSFVFIGTGILQDRLRMFKHLGSILLMIMGILTLYPGYSFINWSTLMGKGMGFTFIALGGYFLVEDGFSRKDQTENYEQEPEEDGRFNG